MVKTSFEPELMKLSVNQLVRRRNHPRNTMIKMGKVIFEVYNSKSRKDDNGVSQKA